MNNNNDTMGISVVSTIPQAHQSDVLTNTNIQITFSADLNKDTISNCIIVFEDKDNVYDGPTSLKNVSQYSIVKGSVAYANKTITFTPSNILGIDTRYIVVVNNNIRDITGSPLLKKFIFVFNTEVSKNYKQCEIISPKHGFITPDIPEIHWKDLGAPSYIMQISKSNKFETLLYENFIIPDDNNTYTIKTETDLQPEEIPPEEQTYTVVKHTPDMKVREGVYFLKVKAENGLWSDVFQFFIKEITDAVVAKDDQDDTIFLDDFLKDIDDELEILEYFPTDNSINNSLKTNIFYIKIKGRVDESRLNLVECEVTGEAYSEEDENLESIYFDYTHGTVSGYWSMIYDETYDCTYVIFTPTIIEDETEETVIATIHNDTVSTES